jgi:hypothetical protein
MKNKRKAKTSESDEGLLDYLETVYWEMKKMTRDELCVKIIGLETALFTTKHDRDNCITGKVR